MKEKMRNFELSSEKLLFARYFPFEFDTPKQANNERKAIFPIKVLIFLARIVWD